jgi:hypothetical protein
VNGLRKKELKSKIIILGLGCKNEGQIALTVWYLKKIGYFCDSCAEDLLKLGLAFKEDIRRYAKYF